MLSACDQAHEAIIKATPSNGGIDFYARVALMMIYHALTEGLDRQDALTNLEQFQRHFREMDAMMSSSVPTNPPHSIH
jgi:hypothetical protein